MLQTIRYTCHGISTPVVAEALAAQGYTVEIPLQPCAPGTTATVLAQGMASVLLVETPEERTLDIECSGAAREVAAQLLESLPFPLQKASGVSSR